MEAEKGERTNLVHDILQRIRAVDCEADKYQIGFWVRERSQSVVFLLAGCIPQRQLYGLACGRMSGVGDVVFEDGRDVFLRGNVD